jgi:hypothetical protein
MHGDFLPERLRIFTRARYALVFAGQEGARSGDRNPVVTLAESVKHLKSQIVRDGYMPTSSHKRKKFLIPQLGSCNHPGRPSDYVYT